MFSIENHVSFVLLLVSLKRNGLSWKLFHALQNFMVKNFSNSSVSSISVIARNRQLETGFLVLLWHLSQRAKNAVGKEYGDKIVAAIEKKIIIKFGRAWNNFQERIFLFKETSNETWFPRENITDLILWRTLKFFFFEPSWTSVCFLRASLLHYIVFLDIKKKKALYKLSIVVLSISISKLFSKMW